MFGVPVLLFVFVIVLSCCVLLLLCFVCFGCFLFFCVVRLSVYVCVVVLAVVSVLFVLCCCFGVFVFVLSPFCLFGVAIWMCLMCLC